MGYEATPCHSVRIKRAFTENVTDTIDFLDLLKSPLLLFFLWSVRNSQLENSTGDVMTIDQ